MAGAGILACAHFLRWQALVGASNNGSRQRQARMPAPLQLAYGFFGAGAGLLFAFGGVRCGTGGADLCGAEPAAGRCWAG